MAAPYQLSRFLESVERRAFKQAMFAVHNEDAALDIVQDSMMKLSEKYGDRPEDEFPMLFQRILQNTIRDFYRRSKVRSMWTTLLSAFAGEEKDNDPLETLAADGDDQGAYTPERSLAQTEIIKIIEKELEKLPARQREAFLLRYWEDMNVAETAAIMGCSEGSVKTHCSRATHTLAAALTAQGVTL